MVDHLVVQIPNIIGQITNQYQILNLKRFSMESQIHHYYIRYINSYHYRIQSFFEKRSKQLKTLNTWHINFMSKCACEILNLFNRNLNALQAKQNFIHRQAYVCTLYTKDFNFENFEIVESKQRMNGRLKEK